MNSDPSKAAASGDNVLVSQQELLAMRLFTEFKVRYYRLVVDRISVHVTLKFAFHAKFLKYMLGAILSVYKYYEDPKVQDSIFWFRNGSINCAIEYTRKSLGIERAKLSELSAENKKQMEHVYGMAILLCQIYAEHEPEPEKQFLHWQKIHFARFCELRGEKFEAEKKYPLLLDICQNLREYLNPGDSFENIRKAYAENPTLEGEDKLIASMAHPCIEKHYEKYEHEVEKLESGYLDSEHLSGSGFDEGSLLDSDEGSLPGSSGELRHRRHDDNVSIVSSASESDDDMKPEEKATAGGWVRKLLGEFSPYVPKSWRSGDAKQSVPEKDVDGFPLEVGTSTPTKIARHEGALDFAATPYSDNRLPPSKMGVIQISETADKASVKQDGGDLSGPNDKSASNVPGNSFAPPLVSVKC